MKTLQYELTETQMFDPFLQKSASSDTIEYLISEELVSPFQNTDTFESTEFNPVLSVAELDYLFGDTDAFQLDDLSPVNLLDLDEEELAVLS